MHFCPKTIETFQILFSLGNLIPFCFKKLLHMELGWDFHLVPFSPRIFSSPMEFSWGDHIVPFSPNNIFSFIPREVVPQGTWLGLPLIPLLYGEVVAMKQLI
jgi:hypothetical protein